MLTRRNLFLSSVALAALGARAHAAETRHVHVTKDPGCECCEGWAQHLKAKGYSVTVTESPDLAALKVKLGIPEDLRSCHTGEIGGLILEGHVPAAAVAYLLREKPQGMIGLSVPGMPVGAPGMEVKGAWPEEYPVVLFGPAGRRTWARFKGASQV